MSDQQVKQQFWSIERVIAFVVAPVVTPLSGALALWLSTHFPGVHVTGAAIAAFAGTTSLGVAGAFIKWLDGRQKFLTTVGTLETHIGELAAPIVALVPAKEREGLLRDIEGIVGAHVSKLARLINMKAPVTTAAPPMTTTAVESTPPTDPAADAWAVPNDPAPADPPVTAAPPPDLGQGMTTAASAAQAQTGGPPPAAAVPPAASADSGAAIQGS